MKAMVIKAVRECHNCAVAAAASETGIPMVRTNQRCLDSRVALLEPCFVHPSSRAQSRFREQDFGEARRTAALQQYPGSAD